MKLSDLALELELILSVSLDLEVAILLKVKGKRGADLGRRAHLAVNENPRIPS